MKPYKVYFDANKTSWNARTIPHVRGEFYDMESFGKHRNSLDIITKDELPPINGKSLLHLQCHFGQDTLSMANLGAKVTGLDFSEIAIKEAKRISQELNIPGNFIEANVLETDQHITDTFDIVYTSFGVLGWLPDLNTWAQQVAKRLKPGGLFYIAEFHPVLYMYEFKTQTLDFDYFHDDKPFSEPTDETYGSNEKIIQHDYYFWQHAMSEIIQPLLNEGLILKQFKEHDFSPYKCFENMEERESGKYVFGNTEISMPHVFSLQMEKPL